MVSLSSGSSARSRAMPALFTWAVVMLWVSLPSSTMAPAVGWYTFSQKMPFLLLPPERRLSHRAGAGDRKKMENAFIFPYNTTGSGSTPRNSGLRSAP